MMTATACPSAEQLRDYSEGRLSDPESDGLYEHLAHCPTCQSELETINDAEDSLIAQLRETGPIDDLDAEPACRQAMLQAISALDLRHLATETDAPTTTDSEQSSRSLPDRIGEYEIVRQLGQGGMSTVYLARHTKLGREVALKVLSDHRLADPRMQERFEAEMRAVGRLSHPNIVTAHDAREVQGVGVLVMESIDGLNLGQLLGRTGPLPVSDACEIARRIAVALQYVHEQGFVHRDIKPSNVMLSREGEIKLLDLGLARLQQPDRPELTGTGQAMGTVDYVAPEQLTNSREVTIQADLYALGCTLFKLICGVAPFDDEQHATPFAKMTAHVRETPPRVAELRPDVPAEVDRLVTRLLDKKPQRRFDLPQDLVRVLEPHCQGSDLTALAQIALAAPPKKPVGVRPTPKSQPKPAAWYRRPVTVRTAIGCGMLGWLLGLLLGIVLTIKYPDGTVVRVPVPPGAEVTLADSAEDDQVEVRGSESAPSQRSAESSQGFGGFNPVAFGILVGDEVDGQPMDEETIEEERKLLRDSIVGETLPPYFEAHHGTWFPIASSVDAPHTTTITTNGPGEGITRTYALVRQGESHRIPYSQLASGIQMLQVTQNSELQIFFEAGFGRQMRDFTKAHLDEPLAVMMSDEIVAAPIIRSPIWKAATITGSFGRENLRKLFHVFESGLEPTGRLGWENQPGNSADESASTGASSRAQAFDARAYLEANAVYEVSTNVPRADGVLWGRNVNPYAKKLMLIRDGRWYTAEVPSESSDQPPKLSLTGWVSVERDPKVATNRSYWTVITTTGVERRYRGHFREQLTDSRASLSLAADWNQKNPSLTVHSITMSRIGYLIESPDSAQLQIRLAGLAPPPEVMRTIDFLLNKSQSPDPDVINVTGDKENVAESLRALGSAFHRFHDKNSRLATSKQLADGSAHYHSWRVALLPYLGLDELYAKYRLDEPWDSEHNQELLAEIPGVFQTGSASDTEAGMTTLQGVATPDAVMGGEGRPFNLIGDGLSDTLLVLDTGKPVPWTKPQDLDDPAELRSIEQPLWLLTCDGSVRRVEDESLETLKKMITHSGGERIDEELAPVTPARKEASQQESEPSDELSEASEFLQTDAAYAIVRPQPGERPSAEDAAQPVNEVMLIRDGRWYLADVPRGESIPEFKLRASGRYELLDDSERTQPWKFRWITQMGNAPATQSTSTLRVEGNVVTIFSLPLEGARSSLPNGSRLPSSFRMRRIARIEEAEGNQTTRFGYLDDQKDYRVIRTISFLIRESEGKHEAD